MREIKERALGGLIQSSIKRHKKHVQWEKLTTAFVHKNCSDKYNSEKSIADAQNEHSEKISAGMRRSKEAREFNF